MSEILWKYFGHTKLKFKHLKIFCTQVGYIGPDKLVKTAVFSDYPFKN